MIKKTAMIVLIIVGALVLVKVNLSVYYTICAIQENFRGDERRYIGEIEKAVQIYQMQHNGRGPHAIADLTVGTDDKSPLLKPGQLMDSWRTPYRFDKSGKAWTITSAGPDRKFNTEDDVTNKE